MKCKGVIILFNFIKSLSWFIKKNWYHYLLIVVVGLLLTVLNLFPVKLIGDLSSGIEDSNLTFEFLVYTIMIPYLVISFSIYIVSTTKRVLQNRLKVKLYYALQVRYMQNILVQDATFFENYQSGDLLTRALGDVKSVNFSGGNRLINIFLESMTVAVTLVAMILINPILAVSCFIPLSFIFIVNIYLKPKVKRNWLMVREKSSLMGNAVLESITNVRTIRAFSKEEDNYKKLLKFSDDAYITEKNNLKINAIFQPVFQSIVAISVIVCYGLGAYYYFLELITLASLLQFSMYLNMFQSPLTNIGNMINNFYQSLISADRLNEIYNSKSLVIDIPEAKKVNEIKRISFKNFSFRYENDNEEVLKDINLDIYEGQTIGIVGKTGSGKSTLVRQLVRQLPICSGTLFVNDEPIEEFQKESLREHVGYVPQEHTLFSRSVLANVQIGYSSASEQEIENSITLADFTKDIENLPYGLDTIVGEYGVTLSGGQKQRLAIARALLKNADILILDDSLSAVDGTTEANIIHSLNTSRKNKTNIIVAHRLSAVMRADQIVVLDDGKIIERGTHDELMDLKGWYYEQYIEQQMIGGNSDETK